VVFRAHDIERVVTEVTEVTDNGARCRAKDFTCGISATASRHPVIQPHTPDIGDRPSASRLKARVSHVRSENP